MSAPDINMDINALYTTDISCECVADYFDVDLTDDSYDQINIETDGTTNAGSYEGMD